MFFSKSPVESEVQISTYKSYVFPFIYLFCIYISLKANFLKKAMFLICKNSYNWTLW